MRTQVIKLNDDNIDVLSLLHHENRGVSNTADRNKMKKILSKALLNELTQMQRRCIMMYYLQEKRQNVIAAELGLNPSTVSRHIKAAKRKLQNIASYYF